LLTRSLLDFVPFRRIEFILLLVALWVSIVVIVLLLAQRGEGQCAFAKTAPAPAVAEKTLSSFDNGAVVREYHSEHRLF
jgi:hypothetical protein